MTIVNSDINVLSKETAKWKVFYAFVFSVYFLNKIIIHKLAWQDSAVLFFSNIYTRLNIPLYYICCLRACM